MPKPYFQDAAVQIFHGDCRELLPELKANVVITDPPYGTGHYATDTAVFTAEFLKLLVVMGPTAVFGWPERLIDTCVEAGMTPHEWVTWWPTNAAIKCSPTPGLLRESECIAVFGSANGLRDLRQPRGKSSQRLVAADYRGSNQRGSSQGELATRQMGDVWTDAAPGLAFQSHARLHPNEKPLSVMRRLVESLSTQGQTILDPFMGSGTTLRAAKDLGRKAIGIEIEERYCEIAAKRMAQGVLL